MRNDIVAKAVGVKWMKAGKPFEVRYDTQKEARQKFGDLLHEACKAGSDIDDIGYITVPI